MIIVTDLDGTLLDAATYSFVPAQEALDAIRTRNIPLILSSSKTRAELERIRFHLDHQGPFIVENGAAVYIPKGLFSFPINGARLRGAYQVVELGLPYGTVRSVLKEVQQEAGVELRGFGDMSAEEIAERTGLPPSEALLAKQREYDEPFVIPTTARGTEAIERAINARGLRCISGGRFHHVTGESDKGRACRLLIDCYRRLGHDDLLTVGLGDSLNDLPMLAAVDRPILVQKPDGSYDPGLRLPNLTHAPGIGPIGWNRAVLDLLRDGS